MEHTALIKIKQDPSLINILPFDTMIKFICCIGRIDKNLFSTVVEIAGERYGIDFIAYSVNKQLDIYANI